MSAAVLVGTPSSNLQPPVEVHNYKVFIIELQIIATAGGENHNYNYCTRKTVIITQLVIQLLQPCCSVSVFVFCDLCIVRRGCKHSYFAQNC